MLRVLVLGGYGLFGGRLVRRLARRAGLEVVVAGRSQAKAAALVAMLAADSQATLRAVAFDLASADLLASLRTLQPKVVVHAAGPFHGQDYRVARACIAARAHYIDLADSRTFVQGIGALDGEARAAGVSVLSGASSVPALSSAVVDHLAAGLASVESIDIGISPGNRTERGLATVQGILGYCGKAIGPARDAPLHGWRGTWRHAYPAPVGERLLSPCDVPDLALLPARYPGTPRVRFGAGLELRLLHRGMNLMAWLAQRGWVRDWAAHARWLKAAADLFLRWGSDAGAMHVRVSGRDADGHVAERQWTLVAAHGDGPYVPTLAAAALVERVARGEPLAAGAKPCIGMLAHDEILAQAEGLAITFAEGNDASLFRTAMGEPYERLDSTLRAFHDLRGRHALHGEVHTEGPERPLGALLARLLGTPVHAAQGAMRFELDSVEGAQTWTRHFPHRTMRSRMRLVRGRLVESLGPVQLTFALREQGQRLEMQLQSLRCLGVPCPRWLLPRITATEEGRDGRLHFDIRAALPGIGRVTSYRGWLDLPRVAP